MPEQAERLARIRRKMLRWGEKRRRLDEKERADGVSCVRTVSASENRRIEASYRAARRAACERDQFERAEVLVAEVGTDGLGECVLVRPDGKICKARIRVR